MRNCKHYLKSLRLKRLCIMQVCKSFTSACFAIFTKTFFFTYNKLKGIYLLPNTFLLD